MGKILKVLGVVFLLLVLGFVGLLIWSHQKGQSELEGFYEAVWSGDVSRVMARIHPDLHEELDEPVLAVWIEAVRGHLGRFEGLSAKNFSTSSREEDGRDVIETHGTAEFEKGEAKAELTLVDGKVYAFRLTADALPNPWFLEAPDVTSYEEAGGEFLTMLLTNRIDEAILAMHENLRAEMPPEKLKPAIENLRARSSDFRMIEVLDHEFKAGETPELVIRYDVSCERGSLAGRVRYQFSPWKGHLVGFNLEPAR